MNTYTFNAVCTCPKDGEPDSYSVTVRSRRVQWTDIIGKCIAVLSKERIGQEEFTWRLHRLLKAEVTTVGEHPPYDDTGACSIITVSCTHGQP